MIKIYSRLYEISLSVLSQYLILVLSDTRLFFALADFLFHWVWLVLPRVTAQRLGHAGDISVPGSCWQLTISILSFLLKLIVFTSLIKICSI